MDHSAELLKEADCWNLRSDEKLLEALRKFSVSINERTQSLIEKVDDLTSETVQVGCHLENTFNEFLILADTQFIENVRFFHVGYVRSPIVRNPLLFCGRRSSVVLLQQAFRICLFLPF